MAEKKYLDYTGLSHLVEKLNTKFKNGLRWKASVTSVAELPAISSVTVSNIGDMYNIQADGKSTADFVEGAGKPIDAGTNVALTNVGTEDSPSLKWDILGTSFNKLTFGSTMPATPAENDTFLFMGDTTYTYTVVASPTGNPQEQGWYVSDGSGYVLTTDTEVQSGTTYYTRAEEYTKGVIYVYDGSAWAAQSSGDTIIAISNAEIDALF